MNTLTPEQRALVDGARSQAADLVARGITINELCNIADEQERRIVAIIETAEYWEALIKKLRHAARVDEAALVKVITERDEQAKRIASLEASVALLDTEGRKMKAERDADRAAFEHALAERDGDVAHLKAENERLRSVVLAPPPERPADVLFVPSVQAAIDVGLNGFAFKLVGEAFVAALPRNPERRPIVVRLRAKGKLVDVEVRLAPVAGEGGAT